MLTAPLPHPLDFVGTPHHVTVLRFPAPLALAGPVAGLTTGRVRTVTLVVSVAVICSEQLPAMQALRATGPDAHPERKRQEKQGALEQGQPGGQKNKNQEGTKALRESAKKNDTKKIKFSTASFLEEETAAHRRGEGLNALASDDKIPAKITIRSK